MLDSDYKYQWIMVSFFFFYSASVLEGWKLSLYWSSKGIFLIPFLYLCRLWLINVTGRRPSFFFFPFPLPHTPCIYVEMIKVENEICSHKWNTNLGITQLPKINKRLLLCIYNLFPLSIFFRMDDIFLRNVIFYYPQALYKSEWVIYCH